MTDTNIFEKATRQKLRFKSGKGNLSTEQLWDLPLTSAKGDSLDGIGQTIQRELRELSEDSLVDTSPSPRKAVLTLSLDVIKRVIEVKQAENAEARDATKRSQERAKLLAALEAREADDLAGMSKEDIEKRLAELAA